jgi:uncharacterized protein (DUF488 family)
MNLPRCDPVDASSAPAALGRSLFSVGHSNQPIEQLVGLLRENRIDVLVDIRSSPHSRFAPQFNEPALRASLRHAGLTYMPMGGELGGRPRGPEFYDSAGHVRYDALATAPFFQLGIDRLLQVARTRRTVILCSEEDPMDCHRRLLVSRVLGTCGVEVSHIRADGRLQAETEIRREEAVVHPERVQLGLFERTEDVWRSTRSVLPSGPLPPSSRP